MRSCPCILHRNQKSGLLQENQSLLLVHSSEQDDGCRDWGGVCLKAICDPSTIPHPIISACGSSQRPSTHLVRHGFIHPRFLQAFGSMCKSANKNPTTELQKLHFFSLQGQPSISFLIYTHGGLAAFFKTKRENSALFLHPSHFAPFPVCS